MTLNCKLQTAALLTAEDPLEMDSDSMIPPKVQDSSSHSYVPFMHAPSSMGSIHLTSSVGTASSAPVSEASGIKQPSLGTARSSGDDLALPSMAGLRDWELDLDALQVFKKSLLASVHWWFLCSAHSKLLIMCELVKTSPSYM